MGGLSQKCKICKLIHNHEDFYIELHKLVIEDGLSQSVVCDYANKEIQRREISYNKNGLLLSLNKQNFSTHFRLHIPEPDRISVEAKKALMTKSEKGTITFDARERAIADSVALPPEGVVEDFTGLEEVVRGAKVYLDEYGESLRGKKAGQQSDFKLEMYFKLLNSYIGMQKDIIQLRSSDKIAGAAVTFALKKIVSEVAVRLHEEVRSAMALLARELPGSSIPEEIGKMIMSGVGRGLEEAVPEIREVVKKEYKIK